MDGNRTVFDAIEILFQLEIAQRTIGEEGRIEFVRSNGFGVKIDGILEFALFHAIIAFAL